MLDKITPFAVMLIADAAGAVATQDWIGPILQTGAIGGVLIWFMSRNEARLRENDIRLKAMERAQDRATRANILMVLSMATVTAAQKEQGNLIVNEIDQAERDRQSQL